MARPGTSSHVPSFGAASIDCQSIIYWARNVSRDAGKERHHDRRLAACSINSLSAHIRASRRSGEGSPESGSQVQSWSSNSGNDTSNAR